MRIPLNRYESAKNTLISLLLLLNLLRFSFPGNAAVCYDANCRDCNAKQVHFDLAQEDNTCHFVMHIPCQRSVAASCYGSDCCTGIGNVPADNWSIDGDAHGLKITGYDIIACCMEGYAVIEPAGRLDEVTPGTITVRAVGEYGVKSSSLDIDVVSPSLWGNCCGGGSSAAASSPIIGSTITANGSVEARFGLGRYAFGKKIGALSVKESNPTSLLSTPCCLKFLYATNADCEVLTNAAGVRQIKAAEGLANIVTNTAAKYYIDIYPLSQVGPKGGDGFYIVSNSPLQTITVENPDGSCNSSNQLRITDGFGNVSQYCWQTNGWWLTNGGGYRTISKTSSSNNLIRTVSRQTLNDASGLVTTNSQTYQIFPFGEKIIQEVTGSGAAPLTNNYTYYTNTSLSTTGLLQQTTYAQGYWEYNQYETNRFKTNMCVAFLNQAPTNDPSLCRMFEYGYGTNAVPGAGDKGHQMPATPRRTVQYLLGHEISRSYIIRIPVERRDIQCVGPSAAWDDPSNLVTTTRWYTNDANQYRIWTIERPDGTLEVRDYWIGANRTNIVLIGAPDAAKTNVTDGTKTFTVLGPVGQMISKAVIDIASGITNSLETYSDYDGYNRPRKVTYLDGTSTWTDYGCCGPINQTNREGSAITYFKDALQRQAATKMNSITTTNVLDAAGNLLKRVRIGSDGSQIIQTTNAFDTAGRLLSSADAMTNITSYTESIANNQLTRTTTYPDGSTRIETHFGDGQLASVTGTAVHPVRYTNGVLQDGGIWRAYKTEIKLDGNGADTAEAVTNLFDMLGRNYKTIYSDGAVRQSVWNTNGQLYKVIDPDGVTTLYQYNAKGELEYTAIDMDRSGVIEFSGTDRIRRTVKSVETANGVNGLISRSYVLATNGSYTESLTSTAETSTDGLKAWNSSFGATNISQTLYAGSGNRYVTNTAPDGSFAVSVFQNGLLQSVTRKDASGNQLSSTTYAYDAHGRRKSVTDARNGKTSYTFDNADRITGVTTPLPGTGQAAQTTTYSFDFAGRTTRTGLPDGGGVTNIYSPRGELLTNYGSRIYPVAYAYDAQGRKTNMVTGTNFAARLGAAATTWKFDGYRGFMTNKLYADGKGPSYSYTPAGRQRYRTWARGITTTYETNSAGETVGITYSDGATSNVVYNLDRQGRRTNIVDGSGTRYFRYSDSGQQLMETNAAGILAGISLTNGYDSLNRRTVLAALSNGAPYFIYTYAFDSASRLTNVSDGTYQADYIYLANSPLVSQIIMRSNSTVRMTTTKEYDFLNRLLTISNQPSADSAISFDYVYSDANQRVRRTDSDGSYWIYQYDFLDQLTSGKHYWLDGTPVAGQQFEYAYDDIGSRTQTKAGGDANGANLHVANYTANNLKQYTQVDVPGVEDIMGIAHPNANVTVNGQSASRKGEYYEAELSFDNSSATLFPAITNQAILGGVTNTTIGNLLLPMAPQSFWYDEDGNMLGDNVWTNSWDAENRLARTEATAAVPTAARAKEGWRFDGDGRWIEREVYWWNGSAYLPKSTNRFLWDGNTLLAVFDEKLDLSAAFQRGIDLTASFQGAGAGGLISVRVPTNDVYFAAFDGNGNLTALASSGGALSGRNDYDPFGGTLRRNGAAAALSPLRFSTQMSDDVQGRIKYLSRNYVQTLGSWDSRDPIAEAGGLNNYNFTANSPVNRIDVLGLDMIGECTYNVINQAPNTGTPGATYFVPQPEGWPLLGDSHLCCVCNQNGINYDSVAGTGVINTYIDPAKGPGYPTKGTTLSDHERIHASYWATYFSQAKQFYARVAPQCVPRHCDDYRVTYMLQTDASFRSTTWYLNYSWDEVDSYPPANQPPDYWKQLAIAQSNLAASQQAQAATALAQLAGCMGACFSSFTP